MTTNAKALVAVHAKSNKVSNHAITATRMIGTDVTERTMPAMIPTPIAIAARPCGPSAEAASRPTACSSSSSGSAAITLGSIGWAIPTTMPNPSMAITITVHSTITWSWASGLVPSDHDRCGAHAEPDHR